MQDYAPRRGRIGWDFVFGLSLSGAALVVLTPTGRVPVDEAPRRDRAGSARSRR